ncbi:MAG: hypothetical protein FD161_715 [Limisphaerales bacterium]|nr:MAG: hypothetical protein FD161_715 [Limisphaerales bacterium]KAG0510073.1 MAG: hypothetical protein E1N63_715 [Limisphaerales bacterium]TXT52916.1 MAG: hypothetical protein FD140_24 [Limisphaerales bacterium]
MSHDAAIIAATRHWVERAVIGLNLCPFAKAVERRGQVRYVVSRAETEEQLLADLRAELQHLAATPADVTDNTLLIHPGVLREFFAFQAFLPRTEAALRKAGFEGVFQVASFHPDYQFADAEPDDLGNLTNRAPYPTLHLLREASITQAVRDFPAAETIYERNIATLNELGREGWEKLGIKPAADPKPQ